MKERVVFRKEFDPYMKMWKYLAVFPDDVASIGMWMAVPIWKVNNHPWRESAGEVSWDYYYNMTKVVHKKDPIVEELVEILKFFYGGEYEVKERIAR